MKRYQPGLLRRCMWSFHCQGYSSDELFEIWKQQQDLPLADVDKIKLFRERYEDFPNFAGDTERLSFFVRLELLEEPIGSAVSSEVVSKALKRLQENTLE